MRSRAVFLGAYRYAQTQRVKRVLSPDKQSSKPGKAGGSKGGRPRKGRRLGPRGGETTVTPGGFTRISAYLDGVERDAVRRKAFEDDRSISDVIRSALRAYLRIE